MLDQMIESRSHAGEGAKRNGLLVTTALILFSLFSGGILYSLFAQNIGVGGEGLELSTLVAPVPLPEEAPPEPEPEPEKQVNKDPNIDIRKEIIANINESPKEPPKQIQTTKSTIPERRLGVLTRQGDSNQNTLSAPDGNQARSDNVKGTGIGSGDPEKSAPKPEEKRDLPPPPPPKPTPLPVPKRSSQGVINGKAISLPKPSYPAAARAVRASGAVNVSVVISKDGSVMSASASSGHPLLRAAAVSAAQRARFQPTLLSGQPVEVSGVIVYNFQP
ncbi:MAG: TonB family protein [Acidobacteria bacterium]|nr:TonB family protein [Acidobacteriota bacterium]